MKVLVEKGANVNAANDAGMTPMHYAVQRGADRIIEYLASKGARFDTKNKQGRTPADLARGRTAALISKLTAAASTQSCFRRRVYTQARPTTVRYETFNNTFNTDFACARSSASMPLPRS